MYNIVILILEMKLFVMITFLSDMLM